MWLHPLLLVSGLDRDMWPSSSQWDMRSLLGASGKGLLVPKKRHKEKMVPFPPLDVVFACSPGAVAAILRPWWVMLRMTVREKELESLTCHWAVELTNPETALPLDVLVGVMTHVFIIVGLPVMSNQLRSNGTMFDDTRSCQVEGTYWSLAPKHNLLLPVSTCAYTMRRSASFFASKSGWHKPLQASMKETSFFVRPPRELRGELATRRENNKSLKLSIWMLPAFSRLLHVLNRDTINACHVR